MQSWASFWLCPFFRNMSEVTEIGQPGRSFAFSHPNQRFQILQVICKPSSRRAVLCEPPAHPLLLEDFAHHFLAFPGVASTLWSVFNIMFWCKRPGLCIAHLRIFLMTRFRIFFQRICSQGLFQFRRAPNIFVWFEINLHYRVCNLEMVELETILAVYKKTQPNKQPRSGL